MNNEQTNKIADSTWLAVEAFIKYIPAMIETESITAIYAMEKVFTRGINDRDFYLRSYVTAITRNLPPSYTDRTGLCVDVAGTDDLRFLIEYAVRGATNTQVANREMLE